MSGPPPLTARSKPPSVRVAVQPYSGWSSDGDAHAATGAPIRFDPAAQDAARARSIVPAGRPSGSGPRPCRGTRGVADQRRLAGGGGGLARARGGGVGRAGGGRLGDRQAWLTGPSPAAAAQDSKMCAPASRLVALRRGAGAKAAPSRLHSNGPVPAEREVASGPSRGDRPRARPETSSVRPGPGAARRRCGRSRLRGIVGNGVTGGRCAALDIGGPRRGLTIRRQPRRSTAAVVGLLGSLTFLAESAQASTG